MHILLLGISDGAGRQPGRLEIQQECREDIGEERPRVSSNPNHFSRRATSPLGVSRVIVIVFTAAEKNQAGHKEAADNCFGTERTVKSTTHFPKPFA